MPDERSTVGGDAGGGAVPAVRARELTKAFGDFVAVDGIDFEIPRGERFGFLGPNGAGKSTTMRMIYRASLVGSGELEVLGYDAVAGDDDRAIKRQIGVVHQEDNLDEQLTVRETLTVFGRFYRLHGETLRERVADLLAFADLEQRADSLVRTLSGGMKRRLMIARGLLGRPELIVLDEPTTGLDPRARQTLWDRLTELRRRRATIVLTTHYMEEAERLCDRLAIMDHGKIVATGAPADLVREHVAQCVVEILYDDEPPSEATRLAERARGSDVQSDRVLLYTDEGEELLKATVDALPGYSVTLREADLADVFLEITGRTLAGDD